MNVWTRFYKAHAASYYTFRTFLLADIDGAVNQLYQRLVS